MALRFLSLLILLFVILGCQREAFFQGHPSSYWVGQLKSEDRMARWRAVLAIDALGDQIKDGIPLLTAALEDPFLAVRYEAAVALSARGERARGAVPKLVRMLKDPERRAREAAAQALEKIDPETAGKTVTK